MSSVVSPRTALPIALKYSIIPKVVEKLDQSEVGSIFKHCSSSQTFYPRIGLFANEFALGYCFNLRAKKIKK